MTLLTGTGTYIVPPFSNNELISPRVNITLTPEYQANIDFRWSPPRYYKMASISLMTYDFYVFERIFLDAVTWISPKYYPHENYSPEFLLTITGTTTDNHASSTIALSGTIPEQTATGVVNFGQKVSPFVDNGSINFAAGRLFGTTVGDVLDASTISLIETTFELVGDVVIPSDLMPLSADIAPVNLVLNGDRLNYSSSGNFQSQDIQIRSSEGLSNHDLLFIGYWADEGVTIDLQFFSRFISNRI
jgi:hypothetical protein